MTDRSLPWLTAAGALAAAGLARAGRGYRPFPSIDDFAYLPMALARLDPQLFTRDVLLRETPLHVPLLAPLVSALQATTGLGLGLWLITIVLSLLTAMAMWRVMRALGVAGVLLPVVLVAAGAGRIEGLGRGEYDGIFGDAFHFQWAALCALLWAYDGYVRSQLRRAAGLMALSLAFHPVVGAHGALAMACGVAFARGALGRPQRRLIPIAVAIGALAGGLAARFQNSAAVGALRGLPDAVQSLFFRLPQEYTADPAKVTFVLLVAAMGVSGITTLARQTLTPPAARMLGLIVGHLVLLAAGLLFYDARCVARWGHWTLLPLQLSLWRTTPLLLALSLLSAAAALETGLLRLGGDRPLRGLEWLATRSVQAVAAVYVLAVQANWPWLVGACCAISAVTFISIRARFGVRSLAAAWLVTLVCALVMFGRTAPLAAEVDADQRPLLDWALASTPVDALFIVPPGFQEFRLHARRSVFVDFKTVTPGDARLVKLWRQRLELVAAPDGLAREAPGWSGVPQWDRTYAGRNTPERISWLLRKTGADYFVWDQQGLSIPPFVERRRDPDPALALAFEDRRYKVYRLVR